MNQTQKPHVGSIPQKYSKIITPLIDVTRQCLQRGKFNPTAFISSYKTKLVTPIEIDTRTDTSAQITAATIRLNAAQLNADCIIFIMSDVDSALRPISTGPQLTQGNKSDRGPAGETAYIIFSVITHGISWLGRAPLLNISGCQNAWTFGTVVFTVSDTDYPFGNLL